MPSTNAVNEILDFAIAREIESRDFYKDLAQKMKNPSMSAVFEQFGKEEDKHRAKLEGVKQGKQFTVRPEKIADLKIADYIVEDIRGTELSYQQGLILAMKREKKAFQLYTNLAESAVDENISGLFAYLAQEEAKHKLRIEIEYDDNVLNDN